MPDALAHCVNTRFVWSIRPARVSCFHAESGVKLTRVGT